jgi:septal ring-binding cell division protein DamX
MKNQLLLISLTTTLLLGCSSTARKTEVPPNKEANSEPKSWFCEGALENASGDWDCAQLTKQEVAQRKAEHEKEKEKEKEKEPANVESASGHQVAKTKSTTARQFLAIDAKTPLYISLAYKPKTPTFLLALPETFWAIQIMALPNQDDLNDFVVDKQLIGVAGAKIASNGKLFYVLLLGVYESKSIAKEAWESRPQSIRGLKPFYRSLSSLQKAIRAVENL